MCLSGLLHPAAVVAVAPRPAPPRRGVLQSTRVSSLSGSLRWYGPDSSANPILALFICERHRSADTSTVACDDARGGTGEEKAPSRQTFNISMSDSAAAGGVHAPTATCHNAPEQSGVMTEAIPSTKILSGIPQLTPLQREAHSATLDALPSVL